MNTSHARLCVLGLSLLCNLFAEESPTESQTGYRAGMVTLGGSASMDLRRAGNDTYLGSGNRHDEQYQLNLASLYAISDQVQVGVRPWLQYSTLYNTNYGFGVSPVFRYVQPLIGRLGIYGEAGPYLGFNTYRTDNYKSSNWLYGLSGGSGLYWFASPHFSLETDLARINYNYQISYNRGSPRSYTHSLGASAHPESVNLSLYYHF